MNRFFSISLIFIIISCLPAPEPKKDFFLWAKKGTIINNVVCKDDQSLGYCLYLPSDYNLDRTWPVIFCFDPKGDGKLPVTLFKETAEKYGYIIAGSNNSRNGLQMQEIKHITDILFADINEKIAVNPNRVYLAGFSGGARIACSIAFGNSSVLGVIACSAGFDQSVYQSNFNFIGIAGDEDMNFLEMKQLEKSMTNWAGRHELIVFNGKHQWPPEQTLAQALKTFELFAIKDKITDTNRTLINDYLSRDTIRVNQLEKSNSIDSIALAFQILNNAIYVLTGLADTIILASERDALLQNKDLTEYLKKEDEVESNEAQKQSEYSKALSSNSIAWWKKELNSLRKTESNSKYNIERLSAKRLLAFISLMSYSYVNATISQENWKASIPFLQIYGTADPDNPDYYYFLSCYLANTGYTQQALVALKKSLSLGFNDKFKLVNDPLLDKLRASPEFGELIK
jgi:hypothetical protein